MHTAELTESIHRTLLRRILREDDVAILRDVLAGEIPRSVRAYLLAEVAQWLREDLMTIPRFAQIRLDEAGLYHVQKTMLQTLATSYVMKRDELSWALRVAVQFVEDYLTRPQWTLEQFVFGEGDRASTRTVLARLDYLAEYAYFPRLLEGILRRRETVEISREEFRRLLEQIDDQIVKQHNPRELALLTKPIFDFLLLKDAALDDAAPLGPILLFFADKKMKIMEEYIGSICQLRGTDTITLTGLIGLIEELYFGKTSDLEPTPELEGPAAGEGSHIEEDLRSEEPAEPVTGEEGSEPAVATPADLPPSLTAHPDLASLITDKQRRRFVKKIFNRDEAFYTGVINSLNTMPTWDDASSYLHQVYEIHELDPFSKIVTEFTDTVQKRYFLPGETES